MLLEDVEFDDFDLGKYDKKIMITNENPQKGTQTDLFSDHSSYSSTSESLKTAIEREGFALLREPDKEEQQVESEPSRQASKSSSKSEEQEQEQQKSLMRRLFDILFDASSEASRDIRDEVEVEMPISRQTSNDSGARGSNEPMPAKKDETPLPSSSSSSISHHPSNPYDNLPLASSNASSRSSTIHYGSSRPASTIHYGSERSNRPISVRSSPISVRSSHISVKSSPILMSSASSSRSKVKIHSKLNIKPLMFNLHLPRRTIT